MSKQITSSLLLIKPKKFSKNLETATNNYFQKDGPTGDLATAQCHSEFTGLVELLQKNDIDINIFEQTNPYAVDAIFPNNWFSTHDSGQIVLYPMFAKNRRIERSQELITDLKSRYGFLRTIDLSSFEDKEKFLEGTGSLVLDRVHKIAYCALSERSNLDVLKQFCSELSYTPCTFNATQIHEGEAKPIYHTNVVMCVGESFASICLDAITSKSEQKNILNFFAQTNKDVLTLKIEQLYEFAGNILQVENKKVDKFVIMSERARKSLNKEQVKFFEKYADILSAPLTTIETLGGGSARCMLAEIFRPEISL